MSNMTFEVSTGGGPPVGAYKAKFVGAEGTVHEEFGAGCKFVFEVVSGNHTGEQATRITSATPTPKNACGKMIAAISGESLKPGAKIDLAPHVGEVYLLQVEETPSGSTRVGTVIRSNEAF